ncbi:SU10 major capsid protein [Nitratifractor salsuginis]|uniref:Uncharacterized protein n=1 Tax=Nitratifractor salsuginis (strain DSM 16511 / JCM 12458 / E9I37-1) TaxID=749222 RepID=E6WY51_NITSE|nr:DUF5309 family protein [Nitratifractor salsuginis]ADV46425.1 hypothetical protein Nitsa_1172 [Nitratifractor salsuginis DSM 16511]
MALTTYNNTVNQKPSVLDSIILQGPSQVPFLKWFGRGDVNAPKHAWITDRLRDPKPNYNLEITGLEEDTEDTKVMLDNVTQIVKNEFGLSRKERSTARYGQKEWPYRVGKVGKEHAKDLEFNLLGLQNDSVFDNYVPGSDTTEARMAGIFHFIPSEHRKDLKDANGNPTVLTYDSLSEIIEPVWERGGIEDESFMLICGTSVKRAINRFAGDQFFRKVSGKEKFDPTLFELETDFGTVQVKIHRLFNQEKLRDKILVGKLSEARIMFQTSTEFTEVPTDKTAKFGRYYTDLTLEVKNPDYFACGEGLK